ncbi:MAG TPA: amino acid adenylation domain-containing protein, partial [Candidatus Deferrimicrobium sp.]|nr:amino acid adenylation domain-containing protein [Candidatus Deferrimicrobium sp.]
DLDNNNNSEQQPALFKTRPHLLNSYVAPRTYIEKSLTQIWQRLTGFDQIGIDDNFFDLGGDSLKAITLIARIHKELNVKVSLPELFNTPTIKKIAEMIENFAQSGQSEQSNYTAIEPVEKKKYYPLSPAQKRLYILHRMDEHSTGYNISFYFLLNGKLNKDKFENAFKRLISRHEILRTSFHMINNEPAQRIWDEVKFEIEILGIDESSSISNSNSSSKQSDIIRNFMRPFDLAKAPLLRAALRKIADEKHLLMVDMHHIVSDAVSINIVVNNFIIFYKGEDLPQLRIQYKDFAEWCCSRNQKESLKQQEDFWLNEFAGEIPVLELPVNYLRPAVQSFEGNRVNFEIEHETTNALRALKIESGDTLFMVLLAIYTIFLAKITNQEDIIVGSPSAGRRHADLEQILGMFVNTLAFRNYSNGEKTFAGFLGEIKEKVLKAFENQDYPYESLVEQVAVNRDTGRNPLFDTMFVLQTTDMQKLEIPGLTFSLYPYENKTSKFDLTLTGIEREGKLFFTFEYCTKLFNAETIERFINYFKNILSNIIKNKDGKIFTFEILPESEKNLILFEFNNTQAEYPKDKTIHALFVEQAEKSPDRLALIGVDPNCLTYHQLNDQADQLAGYLIQKGVSPDDIIGIKMERSVEMIIGIIGILKSGGAYLPIDPEFPQERIDYMLKDSGAKIFINKSNIGNSKYASDLNSLKGCPQRGLHHSKLAYVIFTSGTTGKPKGVMVEHKNVVRLLFNDRFQFDFNDQDTWSLFHSYSFDFSVWEMYGALLKGGRLVIIPKMTSRDPEQFLNVLIDQKITVLNQTPSAFYNLINEALKINSKNLSIRYIIFGGEALNPSRLKAWHQKYPDIKLINMFGITETCVHVTYKEIGELEIKGDISNIGKPIPTLSTYIMDRYQKLTPMRTPGELYVGGEGVARGYLNRPELTAQRFIEHPYKKDERLYRSGDLSRMGLDGEMIYLGRIDQQVQLRGFRIELGEIESQLLKYESIKEAVVIERNVSGGDSYLCAYIVPHMPQPGVNPVDLEVSSLREFLARQLPDYMIPTHFFQIEKIPTTLNGKIDKKELKKMGESLNSGVDYSPPTTEIEKLIAGIWKDVLRIEDVGIFDNFFDLGGNSLNIITINNKIKTAFKKDIPLVKLFAYPTIHSLAEYLNQKEISEIVSDKIKESVDIFEVAVIGMAGRFPGAQNIREFWNNLKNGIESICFFSKEELEKAGVASNLLKNPNYVNASGVLEYVEYFDAPFFGYTPKEAEIMNPQLRIFHECAWEALEDAGYNPDSFDDLIGLYAGASSSSYWEVLVQLSGKTKDIGYFAANNLTSANFLTTMISYKLNLKGPSSFVHTACSTSLVAIHNACRAVLSGECHMALAGGVGLNINQKQGYLHEEGMISSPDGHCRAFDAQANGTVGGNGIGIVVLKRLKNAVSDRDNIYAVIKGSAINNDGSRKVGYTAPSVQGQAEVIRKALAMAHAEPGSIGYIETHGTATPLGDPIEIEALKLAFHTENEKEKRNYCPIGSVKTNIGHLDTAAGVAGFIKTVLCLKHKQIPPSLHFKEPNPNIDFKNSPFYVNTQLNEWKNNDYPRRAGVSSFGIGGTNAHVVLEEWSLDNLNVKEEKSQYQLLLLSAKTQTVLDKISANLADFLKENPTLNLSDTAYTLMMGRKHFDYRRMLVCKDSDEAVTEFSTTIAGSRKVHTFFTKGQERPVIFMFPGLGPQYVNMGRELFETEPVFRSQMNHCFEILKSLTDDDIKEILYPGNFDKQSPILHEKIKDFQIAQPVIFIFEYALAQLLLKWGITPTAMIGYSFGEYVAACLAGVFSLEDALKLIVSRGKLISQLANGVNAANDSNGVMVSIPLAKEELIPLLNDRLDIAIDNGSSCIIAGSRDAVNTLQEQLKVQRCMCMPMDSSYAVHSRMMTPILTAFREVVGKIKMNNPQIPYISNLTGTWITSNDVHNPSYWPNHLSQTVQFAGGIEELLKKKNAIFIEVGPGRDLNALLGRYFKESTGYLLINLVKSTEQDISDIYYLLNKIGHLWLHGLKVNWEEFYSQQPGGCNSRVSLPAYPFERQYYWLETNIIKNELFRKVPDIADWAYLPLWKRLILKENKKESKGTIWMIFMNDLSLTAELVKKLLVNQSHIIMVKKGNQFEKPADNDSSPT